MKNIKSIKKKEDEQDFKKNTVLSIKKISFYDFLQKSNISINGWCENFDPNLDDEFFKNLFLEFEYNNYNSPTELKKELCCGLQSGNNIYLFFNDPSDGYRSYLNDIIIVENYNLSNKFSTVKCEIHDIKKFDKETLKKEKIDNLLKGEDVDMFILKSEKAELILAAIGTFYGDSYYPNSEIVIIPKNLTESINQAEKETLINSTKEILSTKTNSKKRKI